jgi:hypothetical protein
MVLIPLNMVLPQKGLVRSVLCLERLKGIVAVDVFLGKVCRLKLF